MATLLQICQKNYLKIGQRLGKLLARIQWLVFMTHNVEYHLNGTRFFYILITLNKRTKDSVTSK